MMWGLFSRSSLRTSSKSVVDAWQPLIRFGDVDAKVFTYPNIEPTSAMMDEVSL